MDKKKTGNLIREARKKKNYTQGELGALLGVSNKAVSRWETGESFPDIGILENLASVLNVRIQDIVTGDAEVNGNGAVDEVVRIAKLQRKESKQKLLRKSLLAAALLCCFISGCSALGNKIISFDDNSILPYVICMLFSLTSILIVCVSENEANKNKELHKFAKYIKAVALLSFLWSVLLVWSVLIMLINGHIPFGLELPSVGLFINWQLIGLFTLNFTMNALEMYRYEKYDETIHWGWFVSIATMYLTVLYGDLLHRMILFTQEIIESFLLRTAVVLLTTGIFLIVWKKSLLGRGHGYNVP